MNSKTEIVTRMHSSAPWPATAMNAKNGIFLAELVRWLGFNVSVFSTQLNYSKLLKYSFQTAIKKYYALTKSWSDNIFIMFHVKKYFT